ncbi:hypothetical protein BC937DRAFT_89310 [Endogone sp. FLAS-F59071]|nr:hypothetical protein BC937DRAFT_89310 [Endogone sp. FLAS-F59071]|eukprot:RUS17960.1 hypothetical protein BC937DRAFT_89310 [Endogone sp. FLAS-F59071]
MQRQQPPTTQGKHIHTHPLQFIKNPTVALSRQVMPLSLAANVQPTTLPKQATKTVRNTKPQTSPLLSRPIWVLRPERAKYWQMKGDSATNTPSCGTITPTRNPPKMGCTPIISVTKAENKIIIRRMVVTTGDGPFSNEPVITQRRLKSGPTIYMINRPQATAHRKTQRAVSVLVAFRKATTRARRALYA